MPMITGIALAAFLLFGLLNLYIVVRTSGAATYHERLHSTVPLIGAAAGIIGFMGIDALRPYAWAPLLLDVGTAGFFAITLPRIVRERWQFSSFNLLRVYRTAGDGSKTGTLRLYKSGVFALRLDFHRDKNELGISQFSRTGTWQETATGLTLETRDGKRAEMRRQDGSAPATLEVASDFPTFQTDADLSLAGLTFAEVPASA